MKKIFWLIIYICLLNSLFAQKSVSTKTTQFDYGDFVGKVYSNKYFNLKFTFPENWIIQPKSEGDDSIKLGQTVIKGKNAQTQKLINQADKKLKTLFLIDSDTSAGGGYTRVICVAEKLNPIYKINTGTKYIQELLRSLKLMVLPPGYILSKTAKIDTFGKNKLAYYDTEYSVILQRGYATVKNGYGVLCHITYTNQADLEIFRQIISEGNYNFAEGQ